MMVRPTVDGARTVFVEHLREQRVGALVGVVPELEVVFRLGDDFLEHLQIQTTELIRALARFRSEEHTSELQSLMRTSYAVFCLKKKTPTKQTYSSIHTKNHLND